VSDGSIDPRIVSERLSRLAGGLRARQVPVGLGQLASAHAALAVVDAADPEQARYALRAALCSSVEHFAAFDAAFGETFSSTDLPAPSPPADPTASPRIVLELPGLAVSRPGRPDPNDDPGRRSELQPPTAWSELESIRQADFTELDPDQRRTALLLMIALARRAPERPSRRTRPQAGTRRRHHNRLDQRATLRNSLRSAGEPRELRWRARRPRPRRLVFVLDVSGSMRPYAEPLMLYMHAFVAYRPRVEAFAFSTRLTRMTQDLADRDPQTALKRVEDRIHDWSGGTRIGPALATLNREHGRRLGRGAIAIVLSDGWDRGDPAQLERELARLGRSVHRLVWLNPLKARPGYEPLTRGMAAALPHVDTFLAGNSVASLEELFSSRGSDRRPSATLHRPGRSAPR
jgi:uncharacterized protein